MGASDAAGIGRLEIVGQRCVAVGVVDGDRSDMVASSAKIT